MDIKVDGKKKDGIHDTVHYNNNEILISFSVSGGQYDDTLTALNENEVAALRVTNRRGLHVNLRDSSGTELGVSGDPLITEGSVSQSTSSDLNADVFIHDGVGGSGISSASPEFDNENPADPTCLHVIPFNYVFDGSAWDRQRGDSSGGTYISGNVNHDAVDSGSPIKCGAKAIDHGTNPTAVSADDRTDLYANRAGIPFVIGGHPNVITERQNFTAAQTNTAMVSVSPGEKIVVTRISALCDNANSVDVQCRIGFAATTTPTGTGVLLSHPGIAAGSGVVEGNGSGILGIGADGEDLRITSEVPTGGSIDIVYSYYTVPS